MKRVSILTDFTGWDRSYSLCAVAGAQVKMLLRNGYEPIFIACEGFVADGPIAIEGVELRHIPSYSRSNRPEIDDSWEADVEKIAVALEEVLSGVDTVVTHDLVYQNAALKLNFAARIVAQKRPDIQWLHWIHSATRPGFLSSSQAFLNNLKRPFPNSFVIYPNEYDLPTVAKNFGYEENDVRCVHHPIDIEEFLDLHEMSRLIVNKCNLLAADAIGVYPVRLDRGKQVEYCIRTFAQLKRLGLSVRFIVMDFHSTGGDKVVYREWLKKLAIDKGLNSQEVTFTSEVDESLRLSCPSKVVRDLMMISNVYIHPSVSETYSLTTQEAAICGNFLVLNWDWPAMRSIYGESPIYTGFSSAAHGVGHFWQEDTQRSYGGAAEGEEGVDAFARDLALRIAYELKNNRVLAMQTKIRKERNLDYVFKHEMEPLFYARDGN